MSDVLTLVSTLPMPTTNCLDRVSLDVAIARLSAGYKDVFILHDVEGYRHDEIARLLGISEGTSKSQLHKARLRLRDLMGFGDGGKNPARVQRNGRDKGKKLRPCHRALECAVA